MCGFLSGGSDKSANLSCEIQAIRTEKGKDMRKGGWIKKGDMWESSKQ